MGRYFRAPKRWGQSALHRRLSLALILQHWIVNGRAGRAGQVPILLRYVSLDVAILPRLSRAADGDDATIPDAAVVDPSAIQVQHMSIQHWQPCSRSRSRRDAS